MQGYGFQELIWEFIRNEDGTFAVFRNGQLLRQSIPEKWFYRQICVEYGFCGPECEDIRIEISKSGKCTRVS